MGKRGPRPTPTAVLKLHGTYQRRGAKNQPEPPEGVGDPPEQLSEFGKEIWHRAVEVLSTTPGLLRWPDAFPLARYCDLFASYWDCRAKVHQFGEVVPVKVLVKHEDGTRTLEVAGMKPSPYALLAVRYAEKLARLEAEFGMTPSARSRINLEATAAASMAGGKSRFFGAVASGQPAS